MTLNEVIFKLGVEIDAINEEMFMLENVEGQEADERWYTLEAKGECLETALEYLEDLQKIKEIAEEKP